MTPPPRAPMLVLVSALALGLAFAGCTRPSESTGDSPATLSSASHAPAVTATANLPWRLAAGGGLVKIVVVEFQATHGATTLRWQDVRLNVTNGTLSPTSAYVRLPNGTEYGWVADQNLSANESLSAEIHYRVASGAEEPVGGSYAGPDWSVSFALPPPAEPRGSPPPSPR